jgi:hypothetical protein
MNPLQAYELTIKGKLEAIPLPDMEDAIWARISARLDTDMPTDDDSGGGPASGIPPRTWIGGGALLIFLISLISIFYNRTSKDEVPQVIPANPVEIPDASIQPNEVSPGGNPVPQNIINPEPSSQEQPANTIDPQPTPFPAQVNPDIGIKDSLAADIVGPVLSPPVNPPPIAKDSVIPGKKSRGVKGISDNDYKIVPKKDSN